MGVRSDEFLIVEDGLHDPHGIAELSLLGNVYDCPTPKYTLQVLPIWNIAFYIRNIGVFDTVGSAADNGKV